MNFDFVKNREQQTAIILLTIAAILAVATLIRAVGFAAEWVRVPRIVKNTAAQNNLSGQDLKKHTAKNQEIADVLKKKHLFSPEPPKPKPPQCAGILGAKALINNKWYSCGEVANGAKIIEIAASFVTVEWEGKEIQLKPIQTASKPGSPKGPPKPPPSKPPPPTPTAQPPVASVPEPPRPERGGRRRFDRLRQMSREEREKLREKIRNMSPEERQEYFQSMRAKQGD